MDKQIEIEKLEKLALLMDAKFSLFGKKFGLDSLIGLLPGFGDFITVIPAGYIVRQSQQLGVSRSTLWKMIFNVVIDFVIGLIPIVGDLIDFGVKANMRNINLLREDLL